MKEPGSLKVTSFGISGKLTTYCVSLYNNVDLISKGSEDIASERTENWHCRQPHCHLTFLQGISIACYEGNPREYLINLILPEIRVTGPHVAAHIMGLTHILKHTA